MSDSASRPIRSRSLVTRDPGFVLGLRRVVLKRKPALYHFEVPLTDHCNVNCRGCPRFSTICPPTFADLTEFEADMGRMANIFSKVTEIHLVGGEPLLHPQVAEFCRAARARFPKSRICLVTNGTLLMRMKDEFWEALRGDRIVLLCESFLPGLPVLDINLKAAASHVRIEWRPAGDGYVKTPIDPGGGHDAAAAFKCCEGAANRPILRDGRLYPCANIAYADVFRERFGVNGLVVYPTDYISIRDDPDPEQVFAFLRRPVHWCTNCDVDGRTLCPRGASTGDVGEWTTAPSR